MKRNWLFSVLGAIVVLFFGGYSHAAIYLSNGYGDNIFEIDTAGNKTEYASGGFSAPEGLAFDCAGNLYAASFWNHTIYKFTSAGRTVFANSSLSGPEGITFHNGYLYVADTSAGQVKRFDSAGAMSVVASGLNSPYDIKFDAAGQMFVASQFTHSVLKIDSEGYRTVFATEGLDQPTGMAFDSSGNLYVSSAGNDRIMRYAPNGAASVFASSGIDNPIGLVFYGGDLYVASYGDGKLLRFDSNGNPEVVTTGLNGPTFIAAVPEPSAGLLCLLGLGAWAGSRFVRDMAH